jgi:NodT family efflux transporter outer membrane factor (OMF) lipoprotein
MEISMFMLKRKTQVFLKLTTGIVAIAVLLTGCQVGPKYHPPAPPTITAPNYKESPVNFEDADGWKVANPQDAMLRGKWWELFHEPELNALEEQVEVNNENIKQAFENFMEARTLIAEARSQYWPTVTTNPSWQRSKTSQNLVNSNQANAGRTSSEWSFPLSVGWEPDLWAKIRNQVHESQYAAQVSAADLENERLSEQASLAQYYFEIRGQDALQSILNDTVAADKKALDLTQTQYDSGVTDYISVVQARSALKSAQSAAINVGIARAQYEHAIATLIGKAATDFSIPVKPSLREAPAIPIGVPSQLLERRPDVAAAERTLAEANATIGIGYGAFFPSVTLAAGGGFESSSLKHAFDWPSRFWSIGPAVSQTIFNGGLYKAELHQYTATYNADLAAYRQTVLTAFQQVEDYLAAVRIYSQQILRQQGAVKSAQESLDLEMGRYETGIDPYIDVVTAQTTALTDRQTLATLQVEEMTSSVQLIAALGGGWDVKQLPSPAEVAKKTGKADYKLQR